MIEQVPAVDVLVVGGLTIDRIQGRSVAGGSVLYAAEAAAAAGLRVAALTTSGGEAAARDGLRRLRAVCVAVETQRARETISFVHERTAAGRRLSLSAHGAQIGPPAAATRVPARAVLFAPVADEVGADLITAVRAATRPRVAAGAMQGWLRRLDPGVPILPRPLTEVDDRLTAALRDVDLLVASHVDLVAEGRDPRERLGRLRAWAGSLPEVAVTLGAAGAWLDDGRPRRILPPRRVVGVPTIGAGDAFAAVLAAARADGAVLDEAAARAAAAVVALLAARTRRRLPTPSGRGGHQRDAAARGTVP